MDRALLTELKEFLTERMVDNMSTKDLVEYVSNDLFNYFDKLGEHEFLEEARNYWDDSYDEVVEEITDYMKCDFKREPGNTVRHPQLYRMIQQVDLLYTSNIQSWVAL